MNDLVSRLAQKYPAKETLTEEESESALDLVIKNGLTVQGMVTFTTGIFLVDFALRLGGTSFYIGLLSAIRVFSQVLQVPSVLLVEKFRIRRAISVYSAFISRLMVLVIAFIPFLPSKSFGLQLLFAALTVKAVFAAIVGCSWNSWMRDLVPGDRLGVFFGKRLFMTTLLGMILGLVAGMFIDQWGKAFPGFELHGYSLLYIVGFASGMLGVYYMTLTPEPQMAPPEAHESFFKTIQRPVQDENFKKLLTFSMWWNFAVNLAAPFFTVYLLKRLGLPVFLVVALGVLSQMVNLVFYRVWGGFADRFGNKAVLAVSGSLYAVTVLFWTFTTFPQKHFLTIPLLFLIHALLGISSAGVTLASGNIGLKLAPQGQATPYLAALNFVNSLSAGLAPLLGGVFAGFLEQWELSWTLELKSPEHDWHIPVMNLSQLDFLFFFSFLFGIFALTRLRRVEDTGHVKGPIDIREVISEAMVEMKSMSTMGGLRYMAHFPLNLMFSIFKLKLPKGNESGGNNLSGPGKNRDLSARPPHT
ncbi:MAG: MFS transporter [Nitrospinae bacterium CG11_big_fil_rev_8_21_14_0_20_56_8]|nr:MAG: MFS transporter [Nitrospinae bacterium CG11_big_fil_rev_8_21_14_0_20_56_8]